MCSVALLRRLGISKNVSFPQTTNVTLRYQCAERSPNFGTTSVFLSSACHQYSSSLQPRLLQILRRYRFQEEAGSTEDCTTNIESKGYGVRRTIALRSRLFDILYSNLHAMCHHCFEIETRVEYTCGTITFGYEYDLSGRAFHHDGRIFRSKPLAQSGILVAFPEPRGASAASSCRPGTFHGSQDKLVLAAGECRS